MARPVPSSPQDVDRDQNWSITLYDKGIIRFNGHRMIRVLKNKQTNKQQFTEGKKEAQSTRPKLAYNQADRV